MPEYPNDWSATMQPAIRSWVTGVLGGAWSVIWGRQQGPGATGEGPRPTKPFASLQALDLPDVVGRMDPELVDVSPTQMDVRLRGAGEFVLEVQTFSDDDQRAAVSQLQASLKTQSVRDALRTAGLTLVADAASMRDLSETFAGATEFRYVLELPVRLELRHTFTDQPFLDDPANVDVTAIGVT